ncbi:MAG: ATP-binding protein [Pseudomonadota bacterium]|nr:ATP-binding protein [Pseudomonadota bacterium]
MQGKYLNRKLETELIDCLFDFPAVAVLGPRQCGKSTLAKTVIEKLGNAVYLDLENPSDLAKLHDPELFFASHRNKLICLDEIQRLPEIFAQLRSIIDARNYNGQFIFLGSASRDLLRQSSETLAGRLAYLELTPFLYSEVVAETQHFTLQDYWLRGGFPESFLARNQKTSRRWRNNFMQTFLERDIPQLGFRIPAPTLRRTWQMCAHNQGQLLNSSQLGSALGVSHTTLRSYLELLSETFMLRILQPFSVNLKKRLVKSPKVYLRDTGILHAILGLDSYDDLLAHPVFGASWETLVLENVIAAYPDWEPFFYRTAAGAEIDLVLVRGDKRIAIECKASTTPTVSRGFWSALKDLNVDEAWIVAPVAEGYPFSEKVWVKTLPEIMGCNTKK